MPDQPVTPQPQPDSDADMEALFARAAASVARAAQLQLLASKTVKASQARRSHLGGAPGEAADAPTALQTSRYARLLARLATMPAIEQAKGILMAQSGCSADEAFDMLRRASQRSNVPVRQLAQQIVDRSSSASPAGRRQTPPSAAAPTGKR